MPSPKTNRLQNLPDGAPFLIHGLEDHFKCLYLVRAGDSTCKVQGYKVTDSGGYTPFSDFFSPATQVSYDSSRQLLSVNKNGELSIPKEYIPEKQKEETKKTKTKALKIKTDMTNQETATAIAEQKTTIKSGVGRPRKHSIELPKNREFTVNNLASELGVKKFVINNEINKIKKQNPDSIKIMGTIPCGKGKPARVFKLI